MPTNFAYCGFQGQVSSLPSRLVGLSEEASLRGIGFTEYWYNRAGSITQSVSGVLVCACECGPGCTFSFSFGADAKGPCDLFALRGPGEDARGSWSSSHRGRLLAIAPRVLERLFRKPLSQIRVEPKFCNLRERTHVLYLLASLADEHSGKRPVDYLFVESVTLAILWASGIPQSEKTRKSPALSPAQIGIIRELIAANLTKCLSLREMASAVDLSESYFVRAFKGSFGETPYRYVLRERVALAETLIQNSDLPLSEIAVPAGFPDANRMGRTFRQITGRSPIEIVKSRRRL